MIEDDSSTPTAAENCFCVVSIQTTGLDPKSGKIVEIAVAKVEMESGDISLLANYIINAKNISSNAWIFQNSTLTPEMVRNGKDLIEVRPQLQEIFDKYLLIAYSQDFVFPFLKAAGLTVPNPLDNPMEVAAPIVQIPTYSVEKDPDSTYNRAVLYEKFGCEADFSYDAYDYDDVDEEELKWPTFQEAWEHYCGGYPHEVHRAEKDVFLAAELMWKMVESGDYTIDT
ncbi:MAG TPA: exonuclease domain-containing protein [Candidatus Lokiarchaeia archaeon]|nr:exonuclease domain-containing protein [Candidatus Lokiarchaeia archaeon]